MPGLGSIYRKANNKRQEEQAAQAAAAQAAAQAAAEQAAAQAAAAQAAAAQATAAIPTVPQGTPAAVTPASTVAAPPPARGLGNIYKQASNRRQEEQAAANRAAAVAAWPIFAAALPNPAAAAATAAAVPAASTTEAAAAAQAAQAALASGSSQPQAAADGAAAARTQGATPSQARTLGSAAAAATAATAATNPSGLAPPPLQHYPSWELFGPRPVPRPAARPAARPRYAHVPIQLPSSSTPYGATALRLPGLPDNLETGQTGLMPSPNNLNSHLPSRQDNDDSRRELCAMLTFGIKPNSKLYPRSNWSTAKKRSFNSQCNHVSRIKKHLSSTNEIGQMYGYNIPMRLKQARYSSRKKHELQPTKFNKISNRLYSQKNINRRRLATKKNLQQRVRPWRGGATRKYTMRNRTQKHR